MEGVNHFTNKVIDPASGDYDRNKKEKTEGNKYVQSEGCFGMSEILGALPDIFPTEGQVIDFSSEKVLNDPTILERPELKEALARLREDIIEKNKDSAYMYAIQEFFVETLPENPGAEFAGFYKKRGDKKRVEIAKIPDRIFLQMLMLHAALYVQKTKEFKTEEPKLRKQFLKRFNQLIAQGVLEVDLNTVVTRVNRVTVHLRDTLAQKLAELRGEFTHEKDIVYISAQMIQEAQVKTFNHEFLHATSAEASQFVSTKALTHIDSHSGLVRKKGYLRRLRVGLEYATPESTELHWLNEAVTEDLTHLFTPDDKWKTYPKERELFELLRKKGKNLLPKKLFYNAYFENTSPGDINDHEKLKDSNRLQILLKAIDESFGKVNFLTILEEYVQKNGLNKAIEAIKADPDSIK